MRIGSSRGKVIWQVVGGIVAALAVTAASFIWRLPQAHGPRTVFAAYTASIILLGFSAVIVFRRVVRHDYQRYHRLTLLPFFLQLLIWGLFFAFPCIYNPYDWAWSSMAVGQVREILGWPV